MESLSETAKLILTTLSEYGPERHYNVSIFDLLFRKAQWAQHHRDNFTKAMSELQDKEFVEWGEQYVLIVTEAGYNALSDIGLTR